MKPLPSGPWHGLTIDDVDAVPIVIFRLRSFRHRPFFRLVIDFPERPLADYDAAVSALAAVGYVMVQVRDSYAERSEVEGGKPLTVDGYAQLFTLMVTRWASKVVLWEIGNEVDGSWLAPDIGEKVRRCQQIAAELGVRTAVTFYLEEHGRMARWAAANRVRCDVAMISWYPLANKRFNPDWTAEALALSAACGHSAVACGEFGSEDENGRQLGDTGTAVIIRSVHRIVAGHPGWVGGFFFWDFARMCLPKRSKSFIAWDQTV